MSGRATSLATTGATVNVSGAAPPTAGQALIASSATQAAWGNPATMTLTATALTDNSTGTGGSTIAAGTGINTLTIPITSLATGLSTSAIDLLTNYTPGYRFKILSFDFITTIVGAGAGASQVFNMEIGTTNLTGGVLTLDLTATNTIGKLASGTAVSAANVGTASDNFSIEMAAGGTVFTSGAGYFVIKIQNMDTADAVASLAAKINTLITDIST